MSASELRVFADADALADAAATLFTALVRERQAAGAAFSVALSGGSTPRRLFDLLAQQRAQSGIAWERIEFFWSDERAVSPDDPQSNFRTAKEALLDHLGPGSLGASRSPNVHRMPADASDLDAAAAAYAAEIRVTLGAGSAETPRFDLIMLGMGPDGHTASLFPETAALAERGRLVAPNYVPKLDAHRLTFTPALINAASHVLFLIAGEDKAPALKEVREGERRPHLYPAQLIAPAPGALHWYVDRAAAQLSTR